MTFKELGLHPLILKALEKTGYKKPTPVQQQSIPAILNGNDLLVSSKTGSGKTAAFMLPVLQQLTAVLASKENEKTQRQEKQATYAKGKSSRVRPAQPKVLILAPTRELAMQTTSATEQYTEYLRHIQTVAILGGMPYPKQMQLLAKNPAILIATPGRLIDHIQSGKIDLSQLQTLILDEADRMLDMGFTDDIDFIVKRSPENRQTLLFSATLDGVVGKMAQHITRNPETIRIAGSSANHDNISQSLHFVDDRSHKNRILDHLLRDASLKQALVFTATKRDADHIADRLNIAGFSAEALHGDMHQGARNRTLENLRRGRVKVLVATDVAARGIDVPTITHVFNYDLPKFPEDYVHRIGRTGRAERSGIAVSLVNHTENRHVKKIERFIRQAIPVNVIEGFEPKNIIDELQKKQKNGDKQNRKPRRHSSGRHHPASPITDIRQSRGKRGLQRHKPGQASQRHGN